jgi:hypothetical protein
LAKNEEGEFELVLGNRQLISVFLIVVILLAVFFSMGYIVGRNSAPGATVETAQNSKPSAPESAQKETPSPPAASQESPVAPADEARTTQPEKAPPARAERKPAPAVKESKPEPGGERVPAAERTPAAGEPASGQYWQVVATARPDAEIIAEALTKKGFHALVVPAPREGVFRVVVGPLKDAAAQAQTRTGLEAAGFKNPLMRKY